jgi:DNA-directed RNA polymerase subunit M/transcription elongation factor TFIIS
MISLTTRWKVVDCVGCEVEYHLFALSGGLELEYKRRFRRALWQQQQQLPGPLGTFASVGVFRSTANDKQQTEASESVIRCGKCKNKPSEQNRFKPQGVVVTQKQTRSADEGMSNFYTCLDCGNKWRS